MSGTAERLAAVATVADTGMVDAENPWPGLASFREADRDFFYGREAESAELTRLVLRERLTVLFGLSGLGKSSLLAAGLFPRLRQENVLPVLVRLDLSACEKADLSGQVRAALLREAAAAGIEAPPARPGETLWELFHRQGAEFWSPRNRLITPLLVFDQFEEVFTLGRGLAATDAFLTELSDLVEGRPPAAVKARLNAAPEEAKEFVFGRHGYKVLLALREDFLPDLEGLRDRIRSVVHNRLRLTRMHGGQALDVILHPGRALIDPEVAEQVVRFVAGAAPAVPLDELEVEPALLSVICRELNLKRRQRGEAKITADLLEGSRAQILSDFYERSVADLPAAVRAFVEDRLITTSGFRNSVALEDALETPGVTREAVDRLVERRLLRVDERGGGVQRLELTHDVLTGVIRASRDQRRQRAAKEQAEAAARQAEEVAREARRKLRQSRQASVALTALLLAALGAFVWGIHGRHLAEEANQKVQTALADSDLEDARHLADSGTADQSLAYLARGVRKDKTNVQVRSLLLARLFHRNWARLLTTLHHKGEVHSAALSPDGRTIATAVEDGTVQLWKTPDGIPDGPPLKHDAPARQVEWSPDGRRLATVAAGAFLWDPASRRVVRIGSVAARAAHFRPDGRSLLLVETPEGAPATARVWDLATGQPASPPLGGPGAVLDAQWSADGQRVATASDDGTARVWDAATGSAVSPPLPHKAAVNSARFSPDGRRLITASNDDTAEVWEVETGKALAPPLPHQGHVLFAVFSPDGRLVATASADDTARVWDAATGQPRSTLLHGYAVLLAFFSPDSRRVLTASRDGTARIWDLAGHQIGQSMRHLDAIRTIEWSKDGERVLTASDDSKARLWDVRPDAAAGLPLPAGSLVAARFGADARTVLTVSKDGVVQVWDAATDRPVGPPLGRGTAPGALPPQIGADGRQVLLPLAAGTVAVGDLAAGGTGAIGVTGAMGPSFRPAAPPTVAVPGPGGLALTAAGSTAEVWDARSGRRLAVLAQDAPILAAAFGPQGRLVATVDAASVRVWESRTGRPFRQLAAPAEGRFTGVLFPPATDSRLLTLITSDADGDSRAQIWQLQNGRPIGDPMRHEDRIVSIRFSPDGTTVLTGSADNTARLWQAGTGEPIGEPMRHLAPVRSAEFSPDGQRVVTASEDGTAHLWDARNGHALADSLGRGELAVLTASWSPDNQRVVTLTADGIARLWDFPTGSSENAWVLASLAESAGGMELTDLGALVTVDDRIERLLRLRSQLEKLSGADTNAVLARWFLADPRERTLSPLSRLKPAGAPPKR